MEFHVREEDDFKGDRRKKRRPGQGGEDQVQGRTVGTKLNNNNHGPMWHMCRYSLFLPIILVS